MSINSRIKDIRLTAGLTIIEFGEVIGSTKSTVSRFEQEGYNISPRTVQLICTNFHVSEEWLLHGTGPQYVSNEDSIILQLSKEFRLTPEHEVLVRKLLKLPPETVDVIADYTMEIAESLAATREREAQRQAAVAAKAAMIADSCRPAGISDDEWELIKMSRIEKTQISDSSDSGEQKQA